MYIKKKPTKNTSNQNQNAQTWVDSENINWKNRKKNLTDHNLVLVLRLLFCQIIIKQKFMFKAIYQVIYQFYIGFHFKMKLFDKY